MHKKSLLYIILAGISWGTSGIFVSNLKPYGFSPLQMTSARNIIAAIVMIAYVMITNPKGMKVKLKEALLFILSGAAIFFTSASYYTSISLTTQATAVVLMYTAPIFVMFVSVLFMGEKFTKLKLLAVFLTVAGCGLISGIIGGASFNLGGCIAGLMAGILYALYNVLAKIIMQRGNNAVIATAYCFITAGVLGVIMGNPVQMVEYIKPEPFKVILLVIGIGAFTGALPYFLYTLASKKLPASVASAMSSIEPLTAAVISFTVYKEYNGIQSLLGIAAILVAVVILSIGEEDKSIKQ